MPSQPLLALQIRAQFAACGLPLLGDNLYEALAERWNSSSTNTSTSISSRENGSAQGPSGLANEGSSSSNSQARAQDGEGGSNSDSSWCRAAQRDPSQPLGLQVSVCKAFLQTWT